MVSFSPDSDPTALSNGWVTSLSLSVAQLVRLGWPVHRIRSAFEVVLQGASSVTTAQANELAERFADEAYQLTHPPTQGDPP